MEIYVYNQDTMELVTTIYGKDNDECESKASDYIGNNDMLATTYCEPTINGVCGQVKK